MHRFYVRQKLDIGEVTIESLQIVHQLTKVLRVKPGETVIFFDESGFDYTAEIFLYARGSVRVRVIKKEPNQRELPVRIVACHAVIKKDRMEWFFEKGTEVGIVSFVPMITERSIPKELSKERAQKIIKEAAEQSGRAIVPSLRDTMPFRACIDECAGGQAQGILFDASGSEAAEGRKLAEVLQSAKTKEVRMFIGPEGGFSPEEVAYADERGIAIVSPYPTILRSETAGVIFAASIASHFLNP